MEADIFFTSPLKQDVPHSSERSGHFFNSVLAVPPSAIPLTLKTAEISVSALQHSEGCYKFYVSTYIPLVFFISYFFAATPVGSRTFLSCELEEPV